MSGSLETLLKQIRGCRLCVDNPRGKPLPHEPRPVLQVSKAARICVCGQAPGTRVHASGRPFTDPSGDRLRQWMGVSDAEFYDPSKIAIVPMVFCFPGLNDKGGDLPPRRECAPAWRSRLFSQLPGIDLFILVGMYAQEWHMGKDRAGTLTETVRQWKMPEGNMSSPLMIPLPHPSWRNNAWLRKNPWFEERVTPVLQREVRARLP